MNSTVTAVESFRLLGTIISQDLKWDNHIKSIVKKAQQRLYFLCQLRKFNLLQELLIQFYSAIIESVLCTSITVWFSSATKSGLRRLRRVELYLSKAKGLAKSLWTPNIQHTPSQSGRHYRALNTRTARHRNSFFPQAIHFMNTCQ